MFEVRILLDRHWIQNLLWNLCHLLVFHPHLMKGIVGSLCSEVFKVIYLLSRIISNIIINTNLLWCDISNNNISFRLKTWHQRVFPCKYHLTYQKKSMKSDLVVPLKYFWSWSPRESLVGQRQGLQAQGCPIELQVLTTDSNLVFQ